MTISSKRMLLSFFVSMMELFLLRMIYPCRAAVISSNIDGLACPGEEVIYTCVSQGTSQRWRIESEDGSRIDQLYTSGDTLGMIVQGAYGFTLYSASISDFVSTVTVTATISLHNTRLQCTGHFSRTSKTIYIAGTPTPPFNIQSVVDDYHDRFSSVLFTWNAPDDSRVDYYQYQVLSKSNMIVVCNTSNNSALVHGIVYNKNITFLVFAGNCIGQSTPQMKTVNIVGCSELEEGIFNTNYSTFSQAPGAEIVLSCINNNDMMVSITCGEFGRWEPNASSALCQISEDPTDTRAVHSQINNETTSEPGISSISSFIPIFAFGALMAGGLCILAGVVICCMFKFLCGKKEEISGSSKEEHYEVIDPIYATVTDSLHSSSGTQITMDNNHACKTTSFFETTSDASEGLDVANNEAYIQIPSELDIVQMEHNKSYQATPFTFIIPVTQAGLTGAHKQECYDKQSVCHLKNIQQRSGCTSDSMSQKFDGKLTEFHNQDPVLCVKGIDMDNESDLSS